MAEQNYNIPNLYVDLIRKIKQIEGVDIEYIDRLVEILYNDINLIGNAVDSIMSYIPSGTSDENQLVNQTQVPDISELVGRVSDLETAVTNIDDVIPGTASSSNLLATLADIPAIPNVINPVYVEFTVNSWTLVSGSYRASFQIQGVLNYTLPHFLFIRPLSAATETPAENAAFSLITKSTIEGDVIPPVNSSLTLFADTEPATPFKIGVIAWKTA